MKFFAIIASFAAVVTAQAIPTALYNTLLPNDSVYYNVERGFNFVGDVFLPTAYGPVSTVEVVFVVVASGTYNIVISFFNDECLGCSPARTETFPIVIPNNPDQPDDREFPTVYQATFPISATARGPFTYTPNRATGWVGIGFRMNPPPVGWPPLVSVGFADVPPSTGTGHSGFSINRFPLDACLSTGLNIGGGPACPGQEWFNFSGISGRWANGNIVLALWDAPLLPTFRGPFSSPEVGLQKLDVPIQEIKID